MIIVSVVRDFPMYEKLVRQNPFNAGAEFICFDNNKENLPISVRYNQFIDSETCKNDDWIVFCHEDWEAREDIRDKLPKLDKNKIYGVVGTKGFRLFKTVYISLLGEIRESDKSGNGEVCRGEKIMIPMKVDTCDCQFLLVHSSLIKKHRLRFDENFTFDLYVEDFAITAREKHGIETYVFPLKCKHHSHGNLKQRFFDSFAYLQQKNSKAKYIYSNAVSLDMLVYNQEKFKQLKFCFYVKSKLKNIFYIKHTRKGSTVIKIFKIPVFRFKRKAF